MLYWVSWYQPTEDYRPMSYPPNENILGWWCSGSAESGAVLCAMVNADDPEIAKLAVKKDWPEVENWRFLEESDNKLSDRFPIEDWMKPRFEALKETM